jgi:hypothetical protein
MIVEGGLHPFLIEVATCCCPATLQSKRACYACETKESYA